MIRSASPTCAAQRGAERVDVVAGHRGGDHFAARVADGRGQHHGVGLVDLAGLQRGAGGDQFGARRHHQNPLSRNDVQLSQAKRRGQAERGRGEDLARAKHRGARGDILARATQMLAGLGGGAISTVSVPPSVASTGTTAVAPAGTGAPVMMRCAVPGSRVERLGSAGRNVFGDRQFHWMFIGGADDVIGHRRRSRPLPSCRNRAATAGGHVGGQHQAERFGQRHVDRRARRDQPGDDALVFLDGSHGQTG